jgi:hypothetical protein
MSKLKILSLLLSVIAIPSSSFANNNAAELNARLEKLEHAFNEHMKGYEGRVERGQKREDRIAELEKTLAESCGKDKH